MSVFCLSTSAFLASRSATARSYNRAFSIFMAVALFLPWLRSCWHDTTIPVGKCVIRTADDVLLTCWPPLPDARNTSIRRSSSLISISISSSTSGYTNTEANEVCRRDCESNGDAHQTMHALLRPQQPERVAAADLDLGRLDPRFFARQDVEHRDREPVPLGPARVHAHEHLGPVLGLGATRPRMNGEQRIARVV